MTAPARESPRMILLDLLMATMDSISTWSVAAGSRDAGLAWRDAVTARMIHVGRYVPYDDLVADAAAALGLPGDAPRRLRRAWGAMERWPDAGALESLRTPYAFVTNCSAALAKAAVKRSGLQPAFTLSAEEAGWYKPRPDIYRMACRRAGTRAADTPFVAGAEYDAAGASAAGLPAVLVRRRTGRQLAVPNVRVASNLDEALAGL